MIVLSDHDLAFMHDWVYSYEPSEDDEANSSSREMIMAWVEQEQEKRQVAAIQKAVLAQTGKKVTPAQVRKTLNNIRKVRSA